MGAFDLCSGSGSFDFGDSCVRACWNGLPPGILVFAIVFFSIPPVPPIRKLLEFVKAPFQQFLTLQEAEALDSTELRGDKVAADATLVPEIMTKPTNHPTLLPQIFALIGIAQTLSWLSFAVYRFIIPHSATVYPSVLPFLVGLAWLYTVFRAIPRPFHTPAYDLFTLYCIFFFGAILQLGGLMYDHHVVSSSWPAAWPVVALAANLAAVLMVLGMLLGMPIGIPSDRVEMAEIGQSITPEDYTTLFGWISCNWVYPIIRRGRETTLNEKDVWNLSPTMQSRPVFIKFTATHKQSALLRKLWAANSLDLILEFCLTLVSVTLNYTKPFFLTRILDAISIRNHTPNATAHAYLYAILAFICALLKAQADVQHLWHGRRASTRIRSQLIATIYNKALKRKDCSGIAKQRSQSVAPDSSNSGTGPKSTADVGKIVNLMAGDANRVSDLAAGLYHLYGAPFEFLIAGISLYKLLGVSAFAGLVVIVASWPFHSYFVRRGINIQKDLLAARDGRMGVLSELISAIKFIKLSAWEERWIGRTLSARELELKWLVKERINAVMLRLLQKSVPILVSIVSFWVYAVVQGRELTISVAFTSIALFTMVGVPLTVFPMWVAHALKTGVALRRIAAYLDEEEVNKSSSVEAIICPIAAAFEEGTGSGLGIATTSFKWNVVEEKGKGSVPKCNGKEKKATRFSSPKSTMIEDTREPRLEIAEDEEEGASFELRDIDVMFPESQLTIVTGPTASGKTALLMALLGELTIISGPGPIMVSRSPHKVDAQGHMYAISYAAQTPWLQHQSIKDNILFGSPYEEDRYREVVECCALSPDLEMLEDGDETEIGARGISLSGGQKARVALARAVYARTRYVLLDDPLSAVDSHTSRFLYERLLRGPLLANRTVIFVTHHVDLVLPAASYLVHMLDGRIDAKGTINELRENGILENVKQYTAAGEQNEGTLITEAPTVEDKAPESLVGDGEDENMGRKKPRKLVVDEYREAGRVKWKIYQSYLGASSYWIWALLFVLVVTEEVLGGSRKIWIMIWGEGFLPSNVGGDGHGYNFLSTENHLNSNGPFGIFSAITRGRYGIDWPRAAQHPMFYVGIYSAISLAAVLSSVVSLTSQYLGALRASRILFKQLLVTVVRATFRFHDTTPQGRILNRFGKDIETIDISLVTSLQSVNLALVNLSVSMITIAIVLPAFFVPAIFIGYGYYQLALGYVNTGRDLRRMESNTRSLLYSDFTELLEGAVTVRAFAVERRFLDNIHLKIDLNTRIWYSFWMVDRWLLLNFDVLGAASVLITTLFSIGALSGDNSGLAGLCIGNAMGFTAVLYWACRFWAGLEFDLNSVERVVEYLNLPQDPPSVVESSRPPAHWPSCSGSIDVEDLVVKYAPNLPAVLGGVSFSLKAGERVGLLGRTGSGKSTLAMSLLRFVDPTSGRVLIDGIDISQMGTQDLRSRVTFIAQDANLFSGTLKDNLDPFNEYTDAECLDVLQRVHMIEESPLQPVSSPSNSVTIHAMAPLDMQMSAGGMNFSQGQRQLITMARALLRCSSIVILDEATSSMDFATDAAIQSTIREEFKGSLLITIAHRLHTVVDYDRLIILDKGRIAEFDTPWNLIRRDGGIFRNMCFQSGLFRELESIARNKAEHSQFAA